MSYVLTPGTAAVLPRFAWDNQLENADTIVASSEDPNFPVANLATWRVFEQWLATAMPATVTITWSSAIEINAFCIYGHHIGTRGATLTCEYFNGTWNTFGSSIAPSGTEVIYITGDTVSASQARITLEGVTAPEVGHLFVGYDFQPEVGIQPGWQPPAGAQTPKTREAISRNGLWRGVTTEEVSAQTSCTISPIEEARAISDWRPFRSRCERLQPFYMHWNNSIDVNGAAFCTAAEFNGIPYMKPGFESITIKARAVIE